MRNDDVNMKECRNHAPASRWLRGFDLLWLSLIVVFCFLCSCDTFYYYSIEDANFRQSSGSPETFALDLDGLEIELGIHGLGQLRGMEGVSLTIVISNRDYEALVYDVRKLIVSDSSGYYSTGFLQIDGREVKEQNLFVLEKGAQLKIRYSGKPPRRGVPPEVIEVELGDFQIVGSEKSIEVETIRFHHDTH